ncbi:unnamed protein product [Pleuronectes platessa]|uniref:Uncharacterized protein n=1 Tax=Pleuronectes platessa TaxID=8262 RepID=A0A9N7ZE49_PLEPL|nr:unnamed protein product [Pleuronectes platessa]
MEECNLVANPPDPLRSSGLYISSLRVSRCPRPLTPPQPPPSSDRYSISSGGLAEKQRGRDTSRSSVSAQRSAPRGRPLMDVSVRPPLGRGPRHWDQSLMKLGHLVSNCPVTFTPPGFVTTSSPVISPQHVKHKMDPSSPFLSPPRTCGCPGSLRALFIIDGVHLSARADALRDQHLSHVSDAGSEEMHVELRGDGQ